MAGILKRARELLQPEAAITALGAGWLLGPVAGLALGGLQGILAKRLRKSELDAQAEDAETRSALDTQLGEMLKGSEQHAQTDIDRAQLDTLRTRHQTLMKLSGHPDARVRNKAFEELANLSRDAGGWLEDVETRTETLADKQLDLQQQTVTDLAKGLRKTYEQTIENRRSLQASAGQMHQLLNDPDFDPNNGLNRGRLIELMKSNARSMLADPDDLGSALQGAGAPGLIGSVLGIAGGLLGAEDFNFTKDDWRKIATALYDFEGRQFAGSMQRIEQSVMDLEPAAHSLGVLPPDYGLAQYVLGAEEEFPRPYGGAYPEFKSAPKGGGAPTDEIPTPADANIANRSLIDLENWMRRRYGDKNNRRPTN